MTISSTLPGRVKTGAPVLLTAALTLGLAAFDAGSNPLHNPHEQFADDLIGNMSLEQKIQQIGNLPEASSLPTGQYRAASGLRDCEFSAVGRSITGLFELGIPTIREINGGNGIRGGSCNAEPVMTGGPSMTLAVASFDPELVEDWGEVVGIEAFSFANQVLLGPALNLIRSPYAGRAQEYAGEDPYLAGVIGAAQVRGIQSQGVQAQPKHFVGNEHEFQRERWTAGVRIPSRAMHELYLLPFEMAVKDGKAATLMCAFPYLNDTAHICNNHDVLVKTLRERWGFDGWIESDRRAMHATSEAILAGVGWELDFQPKFYSADNITEALANGEITEADIDAVLRPRYSKMHEFGQFDDLFETIINIDTEPTIDRAENARKARALAEAGVTLLKNEDKLLPLAAADTPTIALIGHPWFAGSASIPPRNGDPRELTAVVPSITVSPEQGLESYGAVVSYLDGADIDAAVAAAAEADVVLLLVGTTPRETRDLLQLRLPAVCLFDDEDDYEEFCTNAEEVYCPAGDPVLSENCVFQDDLVQAVVDAGHGDKTAVVLYSGAGVLMDPWLDDISALIAAWFPGQEDGAVLADILFGEINPSGKLPVTFPVTDREAAFATEAQYPGTREETGQPGGPGFPGIDVDDWEDLDDPQLISNYTENLELGYRWYEANGVTPVFPFGFGLSYTSFEYGDLTLTRSFRREYHSRGWPGYGLWNEGKFNHHSPLLMLAELVPVLTVEYTVTNVGERAGAEASQVYLDLPRRAEQPSKRLVGFDKVFLEPGESRRIAVQIDGGASNHPFSYFVPDDPDDLTAWANGEWREANGLYRVLVGGSSAETPLVGRIGMVFPRLKTPFKHSRVQRHHRKHQGNDTGPIGTALPINPAPFVDDLLSGLPGFIGNN
ncbi:beta-glucosidase [Oceanisphaera litoralis]|uniref:beta-glucosidase family protein n=1 Tax=Oceanisphaera litoralis TaxID=225144 RepID=UPI00195B1EE5|nr:glycoside hydrolase family 3 C-terminal domain-containing protein [Oceanisphaera litoralis]MBM7456037.1 beta-glucosidase [Oceanisphaera litoralis]